VPSWVGAAVSRKAARGSGASLTRYNQGKWAVRIVLAAEAGIDRAGHEQCGRIGAGAVTMNSNATTRRQPHVIAPFDTTRRLPLPARGTPSMHDAKLLRGVRADQPPVQIGDRGGIQYPPELPFRRPHEDAGGGVVGIGHRHKIDRQILSGWPKPVPLLPNRRRDDERSGPTGSERDGARPD